MPFIIFFLSLHLMAAEVTTLNLIRNKNELLLMTTDESLVLTMDKLLLISPCKPRQNLIGGNFRENYLGLNCRAEIIKIILNHGFKPIDARTFVK